MSLLEPTLHALDLIESAMARCAYCGSNEKQVKCRACGEPIEHYKSSLSIGHTCYSCNRDEGKGE